MLQVKGKLGDLVDRGATHWRVNFNFEEFVMFLQHNNWWLQNLNPLWMPPPCGVIPQIPFQVI